MRTFSASELGFTEGSALGEGCALNDLLQCVSNGTPVLISIADDWPRSLEPLLHSRTWVYDRPSPSAIDSVPCTIAGRECQMNPGFRLFFASTEAHPNLQPEVFIRLSVVSFAVTRAGLAEQLMGQIISHEQPDLEERRSDVLLKSSLFNTELLSLIHI